MKKHYIYRHIRLDNNTPFYIGIGSKYNYHENISTLKEEYKRAYTNHGRNRHWNNIVNKHDFDVEILMESNNYDYIKEKEVEFITLYGKVNDGGILCNISDGGDGCYGVKRSSTAKKKYSESKLGSKNPQSKKIINVDTLKIFDTIRDGAEAISKTPDYLYSILCKAKSNTSPYVYLSDFKLFGLDECKRLCNKKNKCYKSILNTKTREEFPTQRSAADSLGIGYASFSNMMNGKTINKTNCIYL